MQAWRGPTRRRSGHLPLSGQAPTQTPPADGSGQDQTDTRHRLGGARLAQRPQPGGGGGQGGAVEIPARCLHPYGPLYGAQVGEIAGLWAHLVRGNHYR